MSLFSQSNFKHGACKLQASTGTMLSLTSNDGGNLLIQNAVTGELYPVATGPGGMPNQELFNNTACVEGVSNQSLLLNTLYSVYIRDTNGNENYIKFEFWRTFSGYNPTLNGDGLYIGRTGGPNIGLMYVGQLYTGDGDIRSVLDPTLKDLKQFCYSHFNPWTFGWQTKTVEVSGTESSNWESQLPSIVTVTEGLSESPKASGFVNYYATLPGGYISYFIRVKGTGVDELTGSSEWCVDSPIQYGSPMGAAYRWSSLTANWLSAPPIGVYTIQPVIKYVGPGNIVFRTQLLGELTL